MSMKSGRKVASTIGTLLYHGVQSVSSHTMHALATNGPRGEAFLKLEQGRKRRPKAAIRLAPVSILK